jgi:hypothetical protein
MKILSNQQLEFISGGAFAALTTVIINHEPKALPHEIPSVAIAKSPVLIQINKRY